VFILNDKERKKRAIGYSLATMLILVGVLGLIIDGALIGEGLIGLIFFFICLIISVGIYVYLGCTGESDRNNGYNSNKNYKERSAISNIVWLIATSSFFMIGFIFDGWAYAWIVFLMGAAVESIVTLYLDYKTKD
jgi:hypothetical protein